MSHGKAQRSVVTAAISQPPALADRVRTPASTAPGGANAKISLLFHATPEHAPFLEPWLKHVTLQLGPEVDERLLVVARSPARAAHGRPRSPSEAPHALAEELLRQGAVDRVLASDPSHERHAELVERYGEPGSRALLHKSYGAPIWSGLDAIDQASHELVLHLEAPVFFHCSGPSWLASALLELASRPELCLLTARPGPPTEAPPGDPAAVPGAGVAFLRSGSAPGTAGYFLCDRRRLHGKLGRSGGRNGASSFEQWLAPSRSRRGELHVHGTWVVRAGYTKAPFPAWAAAIGEAIANGRHPREQLGRYDLRLDRAAERDAWLALLRAEAPSVARTTLEVRRAPAYAAPYVRDTIPALATRLDFTAGSSMPAKKEPWGVLLAPYFTKNGNPIYGREKYERDRDDLIQPWWSDVERLGLHARIFHDELSAPFVARYATEQIQFEHADIPAGVSCNDYRFVVFRDWLREHAGVEYAFCTDMFDVRVNKNPFDVLAAGRWIYAGAQPGCIGRNLYVRSKLYSAYGNAFPDLANKVVLNAGILGGPRDLLLPCLDAIVHDLLLAIRSRPSGNHNMGVFNRVLYSMDGVWAHGAPLHSEFRAQDRKADVCFIHK